MALLRLPAPLRKEIEDLRGHFEIRPSVVLDEATLAARVRGVPVEIHLGLDTYPGTPPRLTLAPGWSWRGVRGFGRDRTLRGLETLERWNRTLGLGVLLRELEQRFAEEPPSQQEPGMLDRLRSRRREGVSILARFVERVREAWQRIFGRRPALASPTAVRSDYERLIEEKASHVERYREAIGKLDAQWVERQAKIRRQQELLESLERSREQSLREADDLVRKLRSGGAEVAAIKSDPAYRKGLASYKELCLTQDEEKRRLRELESEAAALHEKLRKHEMQLEAQVRELESLHEEAHDVETELMLTELEQELLDLRTGTSRSELAGRREEALRSVRNKRAELKVSKQLAGVEGRESDLEYLKRGQEAAATLELEAKLGLEETAPPPLERE